MEEAVEYNAGKKEERIYIDVENNNLDRLKHLSMTRSEAIEKLAFNMLKGSDPQSSDEWIHTQWGSRNIRKYFMSMAEAALNALLGESNDRTN